MKTNLPSLVLLLTLMSGAVAHGTEPSPDSLSVSTQELADKIIEKAKKYIGVPYRLGGQGPNTFDCSGFTRYIYGMYGYSLSTSAIVQYTQGREVEGSISNLQKGDLIFFGSRNNVKKLGHVALYVCPDESGDGFKFIHATVRGGIQISSSKEAYYATRFMGARRLIPDFYTPAEMAVSPDSLFHDRKKMVIDSRDTLHLDEGDRRIVLLANGLWAYLDADGQVVKPETAEKLILEADGKWKSIPYSTHASAPKSSIQYYTIKNGDTLSGIAGKCHTSVNALCRLNGIKPTTILKIGKKIRVK